MIVKPGPNATYEALVYAIDELNLNQITKYSIETPNDKDTMLLQKYEATSNTKVIRPNVRNSQIKK